MIAPPSLQLLHVAAHVDAIASWIAPALEGGCVILDRYWWSTYAYSRSFLSSDDAWTLVAAEHPFWRPLPPPIVVYLTRNAGLKPEELDDQTHIRLDQHYREVIERERSSGADVREVTNDGQLDDGWRCLLDTLGLSYAPA
jgi:thymidylate kinase